MTGTFVPGGRRKRARPAASCLSPVVGLRACSGALVPLSSLSKCSMIGGIPLLGASFF